MDDSEDPNGGNDFEIPSRVPIRYHYIECLADHLADCSRAFGGDLQEMLVIAIIGQVHMRSLLDRSASGRVVWRSVPGTASIGASRIADATGIPRQTVRRKLEKLREKGWIEPRPAARWGLVVRDGIAPAHQALADLDARALDRVLRLHAALDGIKS